MFKDLFVNLQRQNLRATQSRCLRVAFFVSISWEKSHRIVWGIGNDPKGSALKALTARHAVFYCRILKFKSMKTRICYDLETKVRKERKRIATQNCRRWQMYYDFVTGERFAYPCPTREEIKATTLPPTNNGGATIIKSISACC